MRERRDRLLQVRLSLRRPSRSSFKERGFYRWRNPQGLPASCHQSFLPLKPHYRGRKSILPFIALLIVCCVLRVYGLAVDCVTKFPIPDFRPPPRRHSYDVEPRRKACSAPSRTARFDDEMGFIVRTRSCRKRPTVRPDTPQSSGVPPHRIQGFRVRTLIPGA